MNRITMLILLVIFMIASVGCENKKSEIDDITPQYSQSDVRNRNLKDAIDNYNREFYRAANSSINDARNQRLRDEDIVILHDLENRIEEKTSKAINSLDSLAVKGKLFAYDFEYNSINKNYSVNSHRQRIEDSKKIYLARVKKENDAFLTKYFSLINELKEKTSLSVANNQHEYLSKTSPLKLRIIINGYETPKAYLDFHPSQKEPEVETIKFNSTNTGVFLNKNNLLITDYNLSTSKVISFDLLDPNSEINLINFQQMLQDKKINIDLKWFYEPERVVVSGKKINELTEVFNLYQKISQEYQIRADKIYTPKHVK